jgi:hypothetical protein
MCVRTSERVIGNPDPLRCDEMAADPVCPTMPRQQSVTLKSVKRALVFAAAVLVAILAIEYGGADNHSGVAVALAVVAAVLLLDLLIRMGRHSQ